MKKQFDELIPLIAKCTAPATAIATTLVTPLAQAESGDLDAAYADHGRLGPIAELDGVARSLEALEGGAAILGGGAIKIECSYWYCYYAEYEGTNFIGSVTEDGLIDAAYEAAEIFNVEVLDIARQADGKVVAVGRRIFRVPSNSNLVAFRLESDGPLDTGFGEGGIVEFDPDVFGTRNRAYAVTVDPDGRVVVAGVKDDALLVLRLKVDGSVDKSFGNEGFVTGPAQDFDAANRLVRASSGGYRVTTSDADSCRVLALTADGAIDESYGDAGYATVVAELGGVVACHSIAIQPDDRLLVAGAAAGLGFAVRLLANGAPDHSFAASEVPASLQASTAIAVAADGKILVGGSGLSGATVMRLQATGELDAAYGVAGRTTIDLPSDTGASPLIHDIAVQSNGGALVAGGDYEQYPAHPFAVRLLGDGEGDSAGVLSVVSGYLSATESNEVSITVRRTGGDSGAVSVAYRTDPGDGIAKEGTDYEQVSDRLHWDDGDAGERTILVPILADEGTPEGYEHFKLALSDVEGGAGLGTRNAAIIIQPDGAPAGQFALEVWNPQVAESGILEFALRRDYYYEGGVCVTLEAKSRSATAGEDFISDSEQYCWDDQDSEPKFVVIDIVDDQDREGQESFDIKLTNPTGGAIVGPSGSATIAIGASDTPIQSPRSRGGGGSTGLMSLLLLGLGVLLRSGRRCLRIRE